MEPKARIFVHRVVDLSSQVHQQHGRDWCSCHFGRVIPTGLQLPILVYDFASTVGCAGKEMKGLHARSACFAGPYISAVHAFKSEGFSSGYEFTSAYAGYPPQISGDFPANLIMFCTE